jgi:hypothetical protein
MRRIRLAAALALAVATAPWPAGATSEGPPGCGADPGIPLVVLSCDGIDLSSMESSVLLDWRLPTEASGVYFPSRVVLPGSREGELIHPFEGQVFSSELAAVSWNLLLLATSLGVLDPYSTTSCSLLRPELCSPPDPGGLDPSVDSDIRAGGSGNFGRRDFDAAVPEPAAALLFAAGFALVARRLGRRPL